MDYVVSKSVMNSEISYFNLIHFFSTDWQITMGKIIDKNKSIYANWECLKFSFLERKLTIILKCILLSYTNVSIWQNYNLNSGCYHYV